MDRTGVEEEAPRCGEVAADLVGYHVGTLSDADQDRVEKHLLACGACLRTYLALKRAADRAPLDRPRPEVRARLRAEVARTFPVRRRWTAPARAVLARRIPLYQGALLAAIAAAIALVGPQLVYRVSRIDDHHAATSIDTSRPSAASLHIY